MFQTLTYFRSVGIVVFVVGGLLPLVWFILSRAFRLRREVEVEEGEWTVYEHDWAGVEASALSHSGQVDPAE